MPILRTVGAVGGVASFLAAGKITAKQLPIATGQGKRTDTIRVAPGFAVGKSAASGTPPPVLTPLTPSPNSSVVSV